jgi:hypothetical protein
MKKRLRRIQILLSIAIPLFILALPAYLRCTQLSQSKFVSPDLSFENSGEEERLPDSERELKVYGPSTFLIIFDLSPNPFEPTFHLLFQIPFLWQKTFVLRC